MCCSNEAMFHTLPGIDLHFSSDQHLSGHGVKPSSIVHFPVDVKAALNISMVRERI